MLKYPGTPNAYPGTPKAYPGTPLAYPGALANSYPLSIPPVPTGTLQALSEPSTGSFAGTVASAAFSPLDVAGLKGWFDLQDSAAFTQVAGTIASITNKVSSVVASTGTLPAYSATAIGSTYPGMDLNGTSHSVGGTEAAIFNVLKNSLAHTMFIVCQPDNVDRTEYIFSIGAAATQTFKSKQWGKTNLTTGHYVMQATDDAGNTTTPVGAATCTTVPQILEFRASSTQCWIQKDGAAADPSAAAFAIGTLTPDRWAIGNRCDLTPDGFLDGKVGEILIYDSELSVGDRSNVRVYLGTKWGIAVTP